MEDSAIESIDFIFLEEAKKISLPVNILLADRKEIAAFIKEINKYEVFIEGRVAGMRIPKKAIYSVYIHGALDLKIEKPETKGTAQEDFLLRRLESKTPATCYLLNGKKIKGNIHGFDNFAILLKEDNGWCLLYKHGISNIRT